MDINGQQMQPCVPLTKPICQRRCMLCKKLPSPADGVSLHRFPNRVRDEERFQAWCKACGLSKNPSPSSVLCSNHFTIEQFYVIKRTDQARLIPLATAVPNVNLPGGPKVDLQKMQAAKVELMKHNKIEVAPKPPPPVLSQRDRELDEELYVCVSVVRK